MSRGLYQVTKLPIFPDDHNIAGSIQAGFINFVPTES